MIRHSEKSQQTTSSERVVVRYSIEYLTCDNKECHSCRVGKGHGPYWYASFSLRGTEKRIFLGKKFKPVDISSVILNDLLRKKKKQQQNKEREEVVEQSNPANRVDRVDIQKIPKKSRKEDLRKSPPPTKQDFEQDLSMLKEMDYPADLKRLYRELIKKYHPDNHPDHPELTVWMAEINGEYNQLRKVSID